LGGLERGLQLIGNLDQRHAPIIAAGLFLPPCMAESSNG